MFRPYKVQSAVFMYANYAVLMLAVQTKTYGRQSGTCKNTGEQGLDFGKTEQFSGQQGLAYV